MPKVCYVEKGFAAGTLAVIKRANEIIEDYAAQGFDLTLRQLYYQFVSRGLIQNKMQEYKKLGSIINDARLAGLIDWERITDRTRELKQNNHWDSPSHIVEACAKQFRIDLWEGQDHRPEVWIEKDALLGVIEPICRQLDVSYFSCRGYTSQSEMWGAAQRLRGYFEQEQTPVIIHLGDHDPSGLDMTRDIRDRLCLFLQEDCDQQIEVRRIALNMDQVKSYAPPPNPAKITDSRSDGYIRRFGRESWELDALDPRVIATLIREEVEGLVDRDLMDEKQTDQDGSRERLSKLSRKWDQVVEFLDT